MNKLYKFELYQKAKIDKNRLFSTINDAWITSGYVIADSVESARKELSKSFDIDSGDYILNFDLGDKYMSEPYFQDDRNENVFIEEFLMCNELEDD